ncbi:MAG: tRNA (N(6)-L-threonylcarbamoyladenosine(37)-C(2))-methylthiotransferase MtaB, partial [Clostridia bacterium]|nr:tRNA (N(6)-L-threonylcarbamoyladenosine(37)-C(2))-methylthiotransferase MtaB [Clostridia bacterium]
MSRKPTVGIATLGCKVNQYESEAIAEAFEACGCATAPFHTSCDVYVINTCTVTAESDRKARQMIRRARQQNGAAFVLVTGCFSQSAPAAVAAIEGVDFVCGNTNKLAVVEAAMALLAQGEKPQTPTLAVGDVENAPFEP